MAADIYPAPLAGRVEILPDRTRLKVNRIRYPYPNTLDLPRRTIDVRA